jgi:hypothetical protein
MPSSAGSYSAQLRLRLSLTALAVAALAASLLLAFASITVPRSIERAQQAVAKATIVPASTRSVSAPIAASATPERDNPASLWAILTPWVLTVDAVAILGLVVAVRMWRR